MGYIIKNTKTEHNYSEILKNTKVPILTIDQKWHCLFEASGKPAEISAQEKKVNELLARQGHLSQELKDLKKMKNTLMQNIVENMEGTEGENHPSSKKLAADKRLIDEINEKMENCEDELLELPKLLTETNLVLMQYTVEYCYTKLRTNAVDIEEIGEWIKNVRIELKKQIIKKQNAEIKNKQIYAYMHDIFGPQVIDIFDLEYKSDDEKSE